MKRKTTVGLMKSDLVDLGSPYLHKHFLMRLERLGEGDKLLRSKGIIVIEIQNDYNPLQEIVTKSPTSAP